MMNNKIRVLVVDDSPVMRSVIKGILRSDPEFDVIASARDGEEALQCIRELKPDIVTMDLEMPRMDGLTALKIIMEEMPVPVLVLSSLTSETAEITFKALDLGAVDFVCKDFHSQTISIEVTLINKLKEIARRRHIVIRRRETVVNREPVVPLTVTAAGSHPLNVSVVAIGVSTGGPKALQDVIPLLPKDLPVPVLVVQHMPVQFTRPFADRLNSMSRLHVKEAETGDLVEPGMVYIGRGGVHLKVKRVQPMEVRIELSHEPADNLYHPSVDVMMLSAVDAYRGRVLGVIMTGMGCDGTEGMKAIKQTGGKTLAQDEGSCVVYGMPKCAADAGAVDKIVPLANLASEIVFAVEH